MTTTGCFLSLRCTKWSPWALSGVWTRKSFDSSSNGIATSLPKRTGPWCIAWRDSRSSKWRPWPTTWRAWGPLTFTPISTTTLRGRSCSRGFRAKRTSWWPPGSSAAGTTIPRSGLSFIAALSDLLLLCTKSPGDSPVTADRVQAKWFLTRILEPKLCTSIPPSPSPTFGSRTRRIVDATIFIRLWTANRNGAAWFPSHNPATTVCGNRERCRSNPPHRCRCSARVAQRSPLSWTRIAQPWLISVDSLLPKNPIVYCAVFTAVMETCVTPVKIVRCCWKVVDASNVWDRILGRIVVIPFPNHPTFVPSVTFRTTG